MYVYIVPEWMAIILSVCFVLIFGEGMARAPQPWCAVACFPHFPCPLLISNSPSGMCGESAQNWLSVGAASQIFHGNIYVLYTVVYTQHELHRTHTGYAFPDRVAH